MRIGIDIRDLSTGIVGVGKAILDQLVYLEKIGDQNEYFLYQNDKTSYVSEKNFSKRVTSVVPYSFWKEQIYFSGKSYLDKLDVFHFPIHLPPRVLPKKTKIVFTVHDLHSELDPTFFPDEMNRYFVKKRIQAIQEADAVIVHTCFVRDKVIELSKVDSKKVHLISRVVSKDYLEEISREQKKKVQETYHLPEKFLLYVGSMEPWKRIPFLIRSFQKYLLETQDNCQLVLIGRPGWNEAYNQEVRDLLENNSSCHWLGYVQQRDLPSLYQLAKGFVSASLWEGYGLIFIEAIAAGLPIIAANHAATPEVVGDAGLLFDPFNESDLVEKMKTLLGNQGVYESLENRVKKRLHSFQIDNYGEKVLELYHKL